MTSKSRICNRLFGKCNVPETFPDRVPSEKTGLPVAWLVTGNPVSNVRGPLGPPGIPTLAPNSDEQRKEADNDGHADQKAEVVFTPGIMYFIHLNARIEEGKYECDGGNDPVP